MKSHGDPLRSSFLLEALDLLEQLEKESLELDADVVRQLLPPHEAQQIRKSLDRLTADLKARLGLTGRRIERPRELLLERAAEAFIAESMYRRH